MIVARFEDLSRDTGNAFAFVSLMYTCNGFVILIYRYLKTLYKCLMQVYLFFNKKDFIQKFSCLNLEKV